MILKGVISFDKNNLPPYIYRFNIAMVVYFAVSIAVYIAAGVTMGLTLGDDPVMYLTLAFIAAFIIGVLIFVIIAMKLRERLIQERTAEIKEEFADMSLEESEAILKEKGIITENGFIAESDSIFGNTVIPFEKIKCFVCAQLFILKGHKFAQVWTRPSHIDVMLCVHSAEENATEFQKDYPLDRALFNFIDKRGFITDYEDDKDFALLKFDKENFCRNALGFKMK